MAQLFDLPEHLQTRVTKELRPGEQLKWVGQPRPSRHLLLGFGVWLFFIPWTAFSVFWIAAASGFRVPTFEGGWSLFPLFGVPFVLVGLGGLSSPFWIYRKARSTVYIITNLRAVIIAGHNSVTVRSVNAKQLSEVVRTERADGSGDLELKTDVSYDSDGDRRSTTHGFFGIPEVKQVEMLLESLAASGRMV